MIPAPPNLVASYKHEEPMHHRTEKQIVAFDDDGSPLVIGDGSKQQDRRLVRADRYRNYDGITEDPHPRTVALLPAGGWRIEHFPRRWRALVATARRLGTQGGRSGGAARH